MQPFLPWPGSKAKCAERIITEFPATFNTYYEPFLGSGSVFFRMEERRKFDRAVLSDTNVNLINCWSWVQDRPEHVKKMLQRCLEKNSEPFYLMMRSQMANPSVFLYVMRAGFSSMYRENRKGEFNVPWRKQDFETNGKKISFDVEHLDVCSKYMAEKNVNLLVAPWQEAIQDAKAGDLVYFDPPYLKANSGAFTAYTKAGFGEGDHVFLRTQARLLAERGVFVALSNADTETARRLYGEPYKTINVANSIKSTATTKGTRAEGLWIWRP